MSPALVLNPRGGEPRLAAVELSQAVLDQAQVVTAEEGCEILESLAGQLARTDPTTLDGDAARIAFWVNVYNAIVRHYLCLHPVRGSILIHLRLFNRAAYMVGGTTYTPNQIEHGLLRANRRPPYSPRPKLRRGDPRLAAAPSRPDPRVHFALNCGACSCPPIRHYDGERLDEQLELATRSYLEQETELDPERCRVALPRLLRLYRADFGPKPAQLEFVAARIEPLAACMGERDRRVRASYRRFDWKAVAPAG